MNRRKLFQAAIGSIPLIPAVQADEVAKRSNGLPPLTVKDVKVITTSGGRNYRWIFLKVITSEPGLYGIGSANNNYETMAVVAALEEHLKPWLIGKDPDRIEDLWQSAQMKTYWRNGPVNNNVLAAMDMALWDIKGKRAGMPVYEMLGGKAHDAVPVYDHQGGKTKEQCLDTLQKSLANGFRHVRVQYGDGYGGGGFIPAGEGSRPESGYQGPAFDEEVYVDTIPPVFEYLRSKAGFGPKLLHDVHSHMSGMNAVELARRLHECASMYDHSDYRRLDSRLHLAIAEATGSASLTSAVASTRMRVNALLDAIPMLERNVRHSDDQHARIVAAILDGRPVLARAAMADHLGATAALLRGFLASPLNVS